MKLVIHFGSTRLNLSSGPLSRAVQPGGAVLAPGYILHNLVSQRIGRTRPRRSGEAGLCAGCLATEWHDLLAMPQQDVQGIGTSATPRCGVAIASRGVYRDDATVQSVHPRIDAEAGDAAVAGQGPAQRDAAAVPRNTGASNVAQRRPRCGVQQPYG